MQLTGLMYLSELDEELKKLKKFIRASLKGGHDSDRTIVADQSYAFTVYIRLPKKYGQKQAETEQITVTIPSGGLLGFFVKPGMTGKTNPDVFVFNDVNEVGDGTIEKGGWKVNIATREVRRFKAPVAIPARSLFAASYSLQSNVDHPTFNP